MKPVITEVGLKLGTSGEGNEFKDFYRHLFGRYPAEAQCEIASKHSDELKKLVLSVENGDKVCKFFNLECKKTIEPLDHNDYLDVKKALHALRSAHAEKFCVLYGEDIGVSMAELLLQIDGLNE